MSDQETSKPLTPNQLTMLRPNRFYVEIDSTISAAFSDCSGLGVTIEKDTYLEGGVNDQQRIILKQAKFSDVTLKRGLTDDVVFWKWINQVLSGKTDNASTSIL